MPETPYYDIVIIGAGIQGSGVAQAAAASGYKTLVIEKLPQAGLCTSSKSSKLIHGGLRYLESGQFKLVRECLQERKILLKNAPQLVKLIPFYIPVYSHSIRPAWLIWIGLLIYSLFSLKTFSIVKKKDQHYLDGLKLKNIKTIFKYYDAQTDDKRLTQAVITSAKNMGADVLYDTDFIKSYAEESIHNVSYKSNRQYHNIKCRCLINCTGPWVDSTQDKISPPLKLPDTELVAGTHIIINRPIKQGAYYIEAADKRAVFVMPWKDSQTLIGTTERTHTDDADNLMPTENEVFYLLETYNHYFNEKLTLNDITQSFSGLRVLPVSNTASFNKSRESLIIHNSKTPALITLVGGKLTAYRASSEEVILKIKKLLGDSKNKKHYDTKNIKL
ncbi:MAG: hypothetical protein DIZ80_16310 [endosymbiont of Galathealinum brachiosum]|uniref:FAD dependent oxidoreductase domain-containing protein n=1 Tax=endosymbiont of Galathealinum brachiosum TaxID=2200906 RepID=A0A370D9Q4_9GAMM|nr:MAG: hypothetical protein DIZ80_16310 [endosymbiont of Galathealinum brachiosum]